MAVAVSGSGQMSEEDEEDSHDDDDEGGREGCSALILE
jgi:hypothetical protein